MKVDTKKNVDTPTNMVSERDIWDMKTKVDALYELFFPETRKTTDIADIRLIARQAMERSLKKRPLKVVK
jgi:hypothetical protein